ncbi:MAG: 50S ribosomal protein L14 [Methanonatronarchaeales archaeon]|nr:50S ribosomal protein L14 [Methanonatronarchaeales archaeon]
MRGLKSTVPRALNRGSQLTCADNTGAQLLEITSVQNYHGTRRRQPRAGVGDRITVSVKKGTPETRKQLFPAVIVRQKKPLRRPDGTRIEFEDNAAVLVEENDETKGTEIKGPVAREAGERFPKVASAASIIL